MPTKSKRAWLGWALVLVVAIGALRVAKDHFAGEAGTENLVNQLWIERIPTHQRDEIGSLVLVERGEHHVGAISKSSRWRLKSNLFVWSLQGERVRLRFPQDGRRMAVTARTWRCAGEAPKPFELCLEVRAGDRSRRYYSKKEWVVRPRDEMDLPEELQALGASAAALPASGDDLTPAGDGAYDEALPLPE